MRYPMKALLTFLISLSLLGTAAAQEQLSRAWAT